MKKQNQGTSQEKDLKCPSCEQVHTLSTIENLVGLAECDSIKKDGPQWSGRTDVIYDTSKAVGVHCGECGWEFIGSDWIEELVV
jgi:hypothetical protein